MISLFYISEFLFIEKMTEESEQCEICIRTFSSPSSVRVHVKHFHEKIRVQCEKCPKDFTTNSSIRPIAR